MSERERCSLRRLGCSRHACCCTGCCPEEGSRNTHKSERGWICRHVGTTAGVQHCCSCPVVLSLHQELTKNTRNANAGSPTAWWVLHQSTQTAQSGGACGVLAFVCKHTPHSCARNKPDAPGHTPAPARQAAGSQSLCTRVPSSVSSRVSVRRAGVQRG